MTRLVLIRHGQTDWNAAGRYQGQSDPPLNAQGLAQAHEAAEKLRGVGLEVLYSSPLARAYQTAGIIARALDIPLHTDPRLVEIDQGDWEGRLVTEIEQLYPDLLRRWRTEPWSTTPPGGESLYRVQERVHEALDHILARHRGQCVGLVAHRLPIVLTKLRYQQFDPDTVRVLAMDLPNIYWEAIEISEHPCD